MFEKAVLWYVCNNSENMHGKKSYAEAAMRYHTALYCA
ncbi:hypothetical protein HM1_2929 [Heliomicrobium modesticaldum Ice1]|uniref:Uncharacterized protein n=1 Tax=Heliobacterium modesticaldum (strain ATCC 51547 / Ice1) TaxID=498761 RepID=B0TCY7_HELMI|nr:hypothetical protein HM1_2929 [Heliomicrobium modesticaldum Ice1]